MNTSSLPSGRLVIIEGPDGVGKSTLAEGLVDKLRNLGRDVVSLGFPGNEPGTLGKHVYRLHHAPNRFGIEQLNPTSLQVLHVAAHIDEIERVIAPSLVRGADVVLDRYWWSTWVYGRLSGVEMRSLKLMVDLELHHWGDKQPSVVFLVERENPEQKDLSSERWSTLRRLYGEIAQIEQGKYPIEQVSNDSETEAAIRKMASVVETIIEGGAN